VVARDTDDRWETLRETGRIPEKCNLSEIGRRRSLVKPELDSHDNGMVIGRLPTK
jgi:hypothetical protein